MRNTLLISCLFFALTGYVRAQDMIFMISTPSCGDDGTIEIIIDSNQLDPDYQFPFDLNYKNIDTKETSSATITDFHHVIDYLKQGNYEVTIDLSDICEYRQVIKVESSITIYPNYINPSCDTDGEVNISVYGGTPGYTYHWSNGSNGQDLINAEAGSYTVTVTDRYDCIATMEFDIESTMPAILYGSRNNCSVNESNGAIMIMRPNSEIIYEWDDPTINPTDIDIVFFSFHKIENLENGVYCVTATDSNTGCKITECIEIVTEGGFDIIDVQVKEPCVSIPDGSISFDILKDFDNGNLFSRPTIDWSDGVEYNGLMQREDLEQGDYNVTVQSHCQTEVINFSLDYDCTCPEFTNVQLLMKHACSPTSTTGGAYVLTPDYPSQRPFRFPKVIYSWSGDHPVQTTNGGREAYGMRPGKYQVLIRDIATGCSVTHEFEIGIERPIRLTYEDVTSSCPDQGTGSISFDYDGGSKSYAGTVPGVIDWEDISAYEDVPSNALNRTNLWPGEYCVNISSNCYDNERFCFEVKAYNLEVEFEATFANGSCDDNSLKVRAEGDNPPFTYKWSNGKEGDELQGIAYDRYRVTVTDALGCASYFSYELFPIDIISETNACPNVNDGAISLAINNSNNYPTTVRVRYGRPCQDCDPYTQPIAVNDTSDPVRIDMYCTSPQN